MIKELSGKSVVISDGAMQRREQDNRNYLMELTNHALTYNYEFEAALTHNAEVPSDIHGGWESPTCQLRGHFLGHWLSAAAMHINETDDRELKAKADTIIDTLRRCQLSNGGKWVASIPEKYLYFIGDGKQIWAPHYTIHKTFMGLIDMYRYTGNVMALNIADDFADWFLEWSGRYDRNTFDDILDFETGGMLEIWVLLYELTKSTKYPVLIDRYYRSRLFEPLLEGRDPLTNMHANTTIPEVIGAAEAYEATGNMKYHDIVTSYWNQAVTERGYYVTGGQTNGEIWGPKHSLTSRLGLKTQEHCTVYNMIRLADYLFRWTGDCQYADYIERNIHNGVMAQTYWHGEYTNGYDSNTPTEGLIAYFLPMKAGSHKGWGTKRDSFYCCHGSMVQANSALNRYIYYQNDSEIYINQYWNSKAFINMDGHDVTVTQTIDPLTGSFHLSSASSALQSVNRTAAEYPHNPDTLQVYLQISASESVDMTLKLRVPWWAAGNAVCTFNGTALTVLGRKSSYISINRTFNDGDVVSITIRKGITAESLPDDPDTIAFMYGPDVLAGLCEDERTLHIDKEHPEATLVCENEREWGSWKSEFKTVGQQSGIHFIPLNQIGYENYCVYFPTSSPEITYSPAH